MNTRKTREQLTRTEILSMLRSFINQRPGLEFVNYGDIRAYRGDQRRCAQQKDDALQLLRAVELSGEAITRDAIVTELDRGGRLQLREDGALDYCTGQYWPTEYRAGAGRALANLLWEKERKHCPQADGHWLRARFRAQYGRGLAGRWFS